MSASVLYDEPGPRARVRHRLVGVATLGLIGAFVAFTIYRFTETGQFEPLKWKQFEYEAIQLQLLHGLLATLEAAGTAAVLALIFGGVFASARISDAWIFRAPATFLVELFRAIPLLILIFFGYYVPLQYGWHISNFWALVAGLTVYNGSVLAEIIRAGIAAIPRGQAEAAYALGMQKGQVVRLILLPQAIRAMLPSIIGQLVVLLKDTALGFIITYPELLYVGKQMGSRLAFDLPYVPTYLVVAAIYIGMCAIMSAFANWLAKRGDGKRSPAPTPRR
ncbi:amino acid ABC transporter permease [Pendulispora rubella]|uniref:Amino acid ABC transporter permease n=1 Tax=Pendulispora rubella TaxID=2741070 RepID=A0ABZ2KXZ0_9BACT